jgi:hypothetical protein
MKIEIDIPDRTIADTLCSAFEGGIGYWARIKDSSIPSETEMARPWGDEYTPHYISAPLTVGGFVQLACHEDSDPKPKPLNLETLQAGIKVMVEKYPQHFADMLSENRSDATTGDVLVQCCVFGEIVFG